MIFKGRKYLSFANLRGGETIYKDKNITVTETYIWMQQRGYPISGLRSIDIKATKDTWLPYILAVVSPVAGIGCIVAILNEYYFAAWFAGSGFAYGCWMLTQVSKTLSLSFNFSGTFYGATTVIMHSDRHYLEKIKAVVEKQLAQRAPEFPTGDGT